MRPPVFTPRIRHRVPGRPASAALYSTCCCLHANFRTAPAILSALCLATRLSPAKPITLRNVASPRRLLALNTPSGIPAKLMPAFLLFVVPFAS